MWDQLSSPWRACVEEAWTAYRAGSIPIGAVITDGTGHLVARGRNRIHEPAAQGYPLSGNRLAHAEMNALLALGECDVDPRTCTLYTTTEPCPMCLGTIRMVCIGEIRYASRDPVAGSMALATATPYMRQAGIRIVEPQRADLEAALLAMLTARLLQNGSQWADLAETWDPECVPAVQLGRKLFESGELARLRADGAPMSAILDALARQLVDEPCQGN
jgi:tRNA(adenine34) deaminase